MATEAGTVKSVKDAVVVAAVGLNSPSPWASVVTNVAFAVFVEPAGAESCLTVA